MACVQPAAAFHRQRSSLAVGRQTRFQLRPLLAAHDVADAFRMTAEARVVFITIDIETIVEREFLAWVDVAQGMDENLPTLNPRLAIRST